MMYAQEEEYSSLGKKKKDEEHNFLDVKSGSKLKS
jgi:hypothetical protein